MSRAKDLLDIVEAHTARDYQIKDSLAIMKNAGLGLATLFKSGKTDFEDVSKKDLLEAVTWVEKHVIKVVKAELEKIRGMA
jgi:hypothetical protein